MHQFLESSLPKWFVLIFAPDKKCNTYELNNQVQIKAEIKQITGSGMASRQSQSPTLIGIPSL